MSGEEQSSVQNTQEQEDQQWGNMGFVQPQEEDVVKENVEENLQIQVEEQQANNKSQPIVSKPKMNKLPKAQPQKNIAYPTHTVQSQNSSVQHLPLFAQKNPNVYYQSPQKIVYTTGQPVFTQQTLSPQLSRVVYQQPDALVRQLSPTSMYKSQVRLLSPVISYPQQLISQVSPKTLISPKKEQPGLLDKLINRLDKIISGHEPQTQNIIQQSPRQIIYPNQRPIVFSPTSPTRQYYPYQTRQLVSPTRQYYPAQRTQTMVSPTRQYYPSQIQTPQYRLPLPPQQVLYGNVPTQQLTFGEDLKRKFNSFMKIFA